MTLRLVHASYHKCLTSYFARVMTATCERSTRLAGGYRHFRSRLDEFETEAHACAIASINNHALDLDALAAGVRVTRFVRDPRDLVVSGYFYHRRGAEDWCRIVDPRPADWRGVNGCIPRGMPRGASFMSYLESCDAENGLLAELEFRRFHFESMLAWPATDRRVLLFRYEDVLGHEARVFRRIMAHAGAAWSDRWHAGRCAARFSAARQRRASHHIRDPQTGQWRKHFTPRVEQAFNDLYRSVLERYGYA